MSTEERIQREMDQTRASLSEKLDSLEHKVAGVVDTVDRVTDAVTDTVVAIKGTVEEAKSTVNAFNDGVHEGVRTVQESLDVSQYVKAHPWWTMAGSVALGLFLGSLGQRSRETVDMGLSRGRNLGVPPPMHNGGHRLRAETAPAMVGERDDNRWAPEIAKLKGLALGAVFGTAREMIVASLPPPVSQEVSDIIDSVTTKAGGEPIPRSAFAGLMQPKTNV